MHVLLVDDDRFLAEYLARQLEERGHRATPLSSPLEALSALVHSNPDIMVCDLVLPELNGMQTIRAVRQRNPDLPVVVLSSLDPKKWEAKCRAVGAAAYLQKPVEMDELLREIEMVHASLTKLRIGLVDCEVPHLQRLTAELHSLGSQVQACQSVDEMLGPTGGLDGLTLLLIDRACGDLDELLRWARDARVPTVVFGDASTLDEDALLRAGASLCISKPVDGRRLLTQARFLMG